MNAPVPWIVRTNRMNNSPFQMCPVLLLVQSEGYGHLARGHHVNRQRIFRENLEHLTQEPAAKNRIETSRRETKNWTKLTLDKRQRNKQKDGRKKLSKRCKQASRQASKQTSKQVSIQANKQASKQTRKQASNQTSKQAKAEQKTKIHKRTNKHKKYTQHKAYQTQQVHQ